MQNLITITDIQELKPLSNNIDVAKKLDPFIQEAQRFEIQRFLGDEFYLKLLEEFFASPSLADQKFKDLFEGSEYFSGNIKHINYGIKPMLVYYSYSRFLARANTDSTAFGMVKKLNPDSEKLTEKTLGRLITQSESGAKYYENNVLDFLLRNSNDYPLYRCVKTNRKTGGNIITAVRKDNRIRTTRNLRDGRNKR